MTFKGKRAVVTGGASGIGRATALALCKAGAEVIVGDINENSGRELATEARNTGLPLEFSKLDLVLPASVDEFARTVLASYGRVDILVNVAGFSVVEQFMDNTPELWIKTMDINLMGPIRLTRALLGQMIEAKGGKIVNVASDAGRVGSTGETVYAAAKGGVIAFTKSLAREVARYQINVNCVCPGPTDTPMLRQQDQGRQDALIRAIPFRRLAKPEEIAEAILFFAGPRSTYVTAQVLSVSGGLTMAG